MKDKTRTHLLAIRGFVYEHDERGTHCEILASTPMTCPLCRLLVPANTKHACGSKAKAGKQPLVDAVRAALKIHG